MKGLLPRGGSRSGGGDIAIWLFLAFLFVVTMMVVLANISFRDPTESTAPPPRPPLA